MMLKEKLSSSRFFINFFKVITGQVRQIYFLYLKKIKKVSSLTFQCNVCGHYSVAPVEKIQGRETPSCCYCGSTLRERSIAYLLVLKLTGKEEILPKIQLSNVQGIGMSDSLLLAHKLNKSFGYINTFYHKNPKLDIQNIDANDSQKYDFIVSSEVFEHVPPPIENAFYNLNKLMKVNSICVFTVPYFNQEQTLEHYPDLYDFRIENRDGRRVLINKTRNAEEQIFSNLHFHGGHGSTLEMRIFSKSDLKRSLEDAGFVDIKFHKIHVEKFGIIWQDHPPCPLTFKKPSTEQVE